jgi:hypothetical protein
MAGWIRIPKRQIKSLFNGIIKISEMDAGDLRIKNVGAPSDDGDATNKTYVDGVAGISGVVKADGTVPMTADLDLGTSKIVNLGNPTAPGDGANKTYVDNNGGLTDPKTNKVLRGKIQLIGEDPTTVTFGAPTAATFETGNAGPYDMSSPGHEGTIIVNPNGEGNVTKQVLATAGGHESGNIGTDPDMSAETDTKMMISLDGEAAVEVECDWTSANSGDNIAAAIQTAWRAALVGTSQEGALVTCAFSTNKLVFTSPTLGLNSAVEITRAKADLDVCDELKIGPGGGSEVASTGNVDDITNVTPEEIVAIFGEQAEFDVEVTDDDKLKFTSTAVGNGSSFVVGDGTFNTVLDLTPTDAFYGGIGLGYGDIELVHSGDDEYTVGLTKLGVAQASLAGLDLSVANKTATQFEVSCETAASEAVVDVIVLGKIVEA